MHATKNLMHVQRTNSKGQCMYVGSYMYLYTVSSEDSMSSMKDQLYGAQHVVVKRNTCTEDTCNNTQRVGTSNQ